MKNNIDYTKWQTWRWESDTRYYILSFVQNLFGEWVLIKKWGGRYTPIHGMKTEYFQNIDNIADKVSAIFMGLNKKRISRGYGERSLNCVRYHIIFLISIYLGRRCLTAK